MIRLYHTFLQISRIPKINFMPVNNVQAFVHRINYNFFTEAIQLLFEIISGTLNNLILFALHIDSKNVFPKPLSKSEEEECFKKMAEGDGAARNKLIEHNLRLVAHIIKKYYSNMKEQDELISIGTIGLIKAVSTFDFQKGNKFATYASRCIENEVLMYFRARKKSQGDIYIDEPIDTDKDGNQLPHT